MGKSIGIKGALVKTGRAKTVDTELEKVIKGLRGSQRNRKTGIRKESTMSESLAKEVLSSTLLGESKAISHEQVPPGDWTAEEKGNRLALNPGGDWSDSTSVTEKDE